VSRFTRPLAVLAAAFLAACGDTIVVNPDGTPVTSGAATVRFVNATGLTFDLLMNGIVPAGNGSLGFGGTTGCLSVTAAAPNLAVRVSGTTNAIQSFTPAFSAGRSYLIVAVTGANNLPAFLTLEGTFTPQTGQAGLRVANTTASDVRYDVYVTAPGGALVSPIVTALAAGFVTNFMSVPAGARQIRLTQSPSAIVALDANVNFTAGQTWTLVIGEPLAGTTALRSALVAAC
jgi:hypothetical protein